MTLGKSEIDRYFGRIGYGAAAVPTLAVLSDLLRHHVMSIPFENLDVLLGRPIRLDIGAVFDKLVGAGRGGYCFEQNGLFAAVLTTLGFAVTPLAARVRLGVPDGVPTAQTHMLLKVEVAGEAYIADVGFGGLNPTAPFLLEADREQPASHETYRFVRHGAGYEMQANLSGSWAPLYRFTEEPPAGVDYEMANWFVSTAPNSRFVQNLTVARPAPDRRAVLLNDRLTIRRRDGQAEETTIADMDGLGAVMAEHFGLDLFAIAGEDAANAIVARHFQREAPAPGTAR
ncbi:MAG TPA: arylamine N-acetyltransferase [Alphaproteobacteria bacterium]|nr:arylamine N-acetyltransferase [Alphaproteobacteria bacterium]